MGYKTVTLPIESNRIPWKIGEMTIGVYAPVQQKHGTEHQCHVLFMQNQLNNTKMNPKTVKTFILALLLVSTVLAAQATATMDPVRQAYKITACLMTLVNDVAPLIAMAMIIIGGITHLTSAESKKQRIQGRRFIIMGLGGYVFVRIIIAIAAMPPFSVTMAMCRPFT
jgi:hypothetical protein